MKKNTTLRTMNQDTLIAMLEEHSQSTETLDLKGYDFSGMTIRSLHFEDVDFSGSNLSDVYFDECKLSNVVLDDADLTGAEFRRGSMRDIRAKSSVFTSSVMFKTKLSWCDFAGSDFTGAILDLCQVYDCGFEKVNFSEATLGESEFRSCGFKYALFTDVSPFTLVNMQDMGVPFAVSLKANGVDVLATPVAGSWFGQFYVESLNKVFPIPEDVEVFLGDHPELPSDAVFALKYLKEYMREHQGYVDELAEIWK